MGFTVYVHRNKLNGKVYVGITSRKPSVRWNNGKGYYQNKHFSAAIEKYGWDSFEHIIVASDCTKEDAFLMEEELIAKYQSNNALYGYNNSIGGECPALGAKWDDEMKKRQSESHVGRLLTDEHKANISKGKKGRPNGKSGFYGCKSGNAGIVIQLDEKTREVVNTFFGYDEMSRMTGYAKTPVKETANGIRKRAYGYLWEYRKDQRDVSVR